MCIQYCFSRMHGRWKTCVNIGFSVFSFPSFGLPCCLLPHHSTQTNKRTTTTTTTTDKSNKNNIVLKEKKRRKKKNEKDNRDTTNQQRTGWWWVHSVLPFPFLSFSLSLSLHIYTYINACLPVCVGGFPACLVPDSLLSLLPCEREEKKERHRRTHTRSK